MIYVLAMLIGAAAYALYRIDAGQTLTPVGQLYQLAAGG